MTQDTACKVTRAGSLCVPDSAGTGFLKRVGFGIRGGAKMPTRWWL